LVGDDDQGVTGQAWYASQVDAGPAWQTQFTWQLPSSGGSPDGLAFVIQGDSATAAGGLADGGLGFAGISKSLAVEIVTTSQPGSGDPAAPFISVQSNGTQANSASPTSSRASAEASSIGDGQPHVLTISYQPPESGNSGVLSVYLDGAAQPIITLDLDLDTYLGLTNNQAWIGFTAANGGSPQTETADIDSWSFGPSFPATQLAITSPALSGTANDQAAQGPVSVVLEDSDGNPDVATADLTVNVQSSSAGGVFAVTSGGTPVTSVTIPAGSTSATFYYGDTQAGSPAITVSADGLASATQTETITPAAAASITLSPASATVTAGSSQTYQVEAYDAFGNDLGNVTAQSTVEVLDNGTCPGAVCTTSSAEDGPQQVEAIYGTLHATAALTVDEAPSITIESPSMALAGAPFSATVYTSDDYPVPSISESGSLPDGVTFADQGNGTAVLSGTPAVSSVGSYSITFTADNGVSPAATLDYTLTVMADTTTTVSASTTAPLFGAPVTVTAGVTAPGQLPVTGTVTFYNGETELATVAVSGGQASYTTAALPPGTHSIVAHYSGSATLEPSTSQADVTIGFSQACITGTVSLGLTVGAGQAICVTQPAVISGPVTVEAGGALWMTGGHIRGAFMADGGSAISICGAALHRSLTVSGTTGLVQVGGTGPSCPGNTIKGPVKLTRNKAGIQLSGNGISRRVTVNHNVATRTPGAINGIEGNKIAGALSCTGNKPPPTDGGQPNTVSGPRSGQCDVPGF
jgi:Bacterial Ig-like domain (group 3)/Legume lectin domain